jgi:hypothetical protein
MDKKKINEKKYGNFEKGRFFGDYEIISEPYDDRVWCAIVYQCKCRKCGEIKRVEGKALVVGQQCRCHRRIDLDLKKKKRAEYKKAWGERNKERIYENKKGKRKPEWNLRYLYHIPKGDYEKLLTIQNKQCWICGRLHDETIPRGRGKLQIDHDHDTDKIRGLLCHNCNVILGLCHEDKSVLLQMIKYIEENKNEEVSNNPENQKS